MLSRVNQWDWNAATISAIAEAGSLLVASVVAAFVLVQVMQAKKLREEQARPYIVVDFELSRNGIAIVVRNIGSTPAFDVSVVFDKRLTSTIAQRKPFEDSSVFSKPIPMVAPGRVISVPFDRVPDRLTNTELPTAYVATVSYRDARQTLGPEIFPLDLSVYVDTLVPRKNQHDIASAVEDLNKTFTSITGSHGLRVRSSSADRASKREARETGIEMLARRMRREGPISGAKSHLCEWTRSNRWRWGG